MTEEVDKIQSLEDMASDMAVSNGYAEHTEGEQLETPMGVPFGWFGITMLLNILQYMVLLGLSLVVLIIIRVSMPASMLP